MGSSHQASTWCCVEIWLKSIVLWWYLRRNRAYRYVYTISSVFAKESGCLSKAEDEKERRKDEHQARLYVEASRLLEALRINRKSRLWRDIWSRVIVFVGVLKDVCSFGGFASGRGQPLRGICGTKGETAELEGNWKRVR